MLLSHTGACPLHPDPGDGPRCRWCGAVTLGTGPSSPTASPYEIPEVRVRPRLAELESLTAEGLTDAEIAAWLKALGCSLTADQVGELLVAVHLR